MKVTSAIRHLASGAGLLVVTGILVAACTAAAPGTSAPAPAPTTQNASGNKAAPAATPMSQPASKDSQSATQGQTVEVTLNEWGISFSPSAPKAGPIHFVVKNPGQFPHALAINGQGIDAKSATIKGGESTTFDVNLTAGTYHFWCPVGNHKDRGMDGQLTVGAGGSTSGGSSSSSSSSSGSGYGY